MSKYSEETLVKWGGKSGELVYDNDTKEIRYSAQGLAGEHQEKVIVGSFLFIGVIAYKYLGAFIEKDLLEYIMLSVFWIAMALLLPPKKVVRFFFNSIATISLLLGLLFFVNALLVGLYMWLDIDIYFSLDTSTGGNLLFSILYMFASLAIYALSGLLAGLFE